MAMSNEKKNAGDSTEKKRGTGSMPPAPRTTGRRRVKYGLNVAVLMISVMFILVMVNWFATANEKRFDLTAGRAYSLSPQTLAILDSLQEPCTLTLLFSESDPNLTEAQQASIQSARHQVEDVLREFERRSDKIRIKRIDPTDASPKARSDYEELLRHLRESRKELIAEYETTLTKANAQVDTLKEFLKKELPTEADQLALLDQSHQQWRQFRQIYQVISTLPVVLDQLTREAQNDLEADPNRRPLPDWERARSTMVQVFQQPASTFREVARICRDAENDASLTEKFKAALEPMAVRFSAQADELEKVKDELADLKPIGLSRIVSQITTRNCVLLSDSSDTNVIPFNALFPAPTVQQMQDQQPVDRRFAGERVVSSAIRRLTIKEPSTVVICHAEPGDPLQPRGQGDASIRAVVQQIRDLGFDVKLWNVTLGEKPEVKSNEFGRPVWVILPPRPNMGGPQDSQGGAQLADVAEQLIADGERVMMNFWPSPMVGFGQPDYWNKVTKALGVKADSGKEVFQHFPGPSGRSQSAATVTINEFNSDNLIGSSVTGLDTLFVASVPLILKGETGFEDSSKEDDEPSTDSPNSEESETAEKAKNDDDADGDEGDGDDDIRRTLIAHIQPTKMIWAEANWMQAGPDLKPPSEVAKDPIHLAVSVERRTATGTQRCVVVGSVLWFDDNIVNQQVLSEGALMTFYPGNAELFVNSVCWLAGIDELIAPSAMTQTVSRLTGLTRGTVMTYRVFLMAILPLLVLGAGVGVWVMRRG